MGHDIYVETMQGEIYYARFPCWTASARPFYLVYDAEHCYGYYSGTGDIIRIERCHLEDIQFRNRAFQSVNWDFDEADARMALQIGESVQAIENYFQNTPPTLADETYFLIKQLAPESITKRIAAYASTDSAEVSIDFR